MARTPESVRRSESGESRSSTSREPFDHLIQHIKQYDPMLYEALKRLHNLDENITNITTVAAAEGDHKEIRAIIPGAAVVATDVMDNRYRVTIDDTKKIKLSRAAATVKTTNPAGADYIADIQRSVDQAVLFTSLFPVGNANKVIIKDGKHEGDTKIFVIDELFNGDELRLDVLQTGDAVGIEICLQGKIVDK